MRSRFDEQLALLNRELIEMGALCEEVIAMVGAGADGGRRRAGRGRSRRWTAEIDRKERDVESLCLKLLLAAAARGAGPAADLRRAENDHGHGAHRRSGGGHGGDRLLSERPHARRTSACMTEMAARHHQNGDGKC